MTGCRSLSRDGVPAEPTFTSSIDQRRDKKLMTPPFYRPSISTGGDKLACSTGRIKIWQICCECGWTVVRWIHGVHIVQIVKARPRDTPETPHAGWTGNTTWGSESTSSQGGGFQEIVAGVWETRNPLDDYVAHFWNKKKWSGFFSSHKWVRFQGAELASNVSLLSKKQQLNIIFKL